MRAFYARRYVTRSVFQRFILTYITLVILMTLCVGLMANFLYVRTYIAEMQTLQTGLMTQYALLLETKLFARSDEIFGALYTPQSDVVTLAEVMLSDAPGSQSLTRMRDLLTQLGGSHSEIYEISLYLRAQDAVLSSQYGLKYIGRLNKGNAYYAQWTGLTESPETKVAGIHAFEHVGTAYRVIAFVRSYPTTKPLRLGRGAIAVSFDEGMLRRMLSDLLGQDEGALRIVEASGRIVSGSDGRFEDEALDALWASQPELLSGAGVTGILDGRHTGCYVALSGPLPFGWRIVKTIPSDSFFAGIGRMRAGLALVCLVAIALGVAVACFFSVRMYTPLKALTQALPAPSKPEAGNEFILLDQTIQGLRAHIQALHQRINRNLPLLRGNLVLALIGNTIGSRAVLEQRLEQVNLAVPQDAPCHLVLVTLSGKLRASLPREDLTLIERDLTEQLQLLSDTDRTVLCCVPREDQMVAALLGGAADPMTWIAPFASHVAQHYRGVVDVAMPEPQRDPLALSLAYARAQQLHGLHFFHPEETLFLPQPFDPLPEECGRQAARFAETLRAGSIGEARAVFHALCTTLSNCRCAPEAAWEVLDRLLATLVAFADKTAAALGGLRPVPDGRAESLPALENAALAWLEEAEALREREDRIHSDYVVEKLKAYIAGHLGEDLSLARLSGLVHLSPNYASRQFKEAMGVSLSAYITSLRMERAKALLAGTEENIERIAEQVGYPTHHHFSKKFKELHACTPKQYRERIQRVS